MQILKTFPFRSPGERFPERRYAIVDQENGTYTIAEQYFYRTIDDGGSLVAEGWSTLPTQVSIFADSELAESEIAEMLVRTGK